MIVHLCMKPDGEFETVVDDSLPPLGLGDVLLQKWIVREIVKRGPNEFEVEVKSVHAREQKDSYKGFVAEAFADLAVRTELFRVEYRAMKPNCRAWSGRKSGFASGDEAIEYGLKQTKEWIDAELANPHLLNWLEEWSRRADLNR
ncbi:MAG: hypothetical protein WB919_15985 [Candidatus Sulfotelmatobacter sp.]